MSERRKNPDKHYVEEAKTSANALTTIAGVLVGAGLGGPVGAVVGGATANRATKAITTLHTMAKDPEAAKDGYDQACRDLNKFYTEYKELMATRPTDYTNLADKMRINHAYIKEAHLREEIMLAMGFSEYYSSKIPKNHIYHSNESRYETDSKYKDHRQLAEAYEHQHEDVKNTNKQIEEYLKKESGAALATKEAMEKFKAANKEQEQLLDSLNATMKKPTQDVEFLKQLENQAFHDYPRSDHDEYLHNFGPTLEESSPEATRPIIDPMIKNMEQYVSRVKGLNDWHLKKITEAGSDQERAIWESRRNDLARKNHLFTQSYRESFRSTMAPGTLDRLFKELDLLLSPAPNASNPENPETVQPGSSALWQNPLLNQVFSQPVSLSFDPEIAGRIGGLKQEMEAQAEFLFSPEALLAGDEQPGQAAQVRQTEPSKAIDQAQMERIMREQASLMIKKHEEDLVRKMASQCAVPWRVF